MAHFRFLHRQLSSLVYLITCDPENRRVRTYSEGVRPARDAQRRSSRILYKRRQLQHVSWSYNHVSR